MISAPLGLASLAVLVLAPVQDVGETPQSRAAAGERIADRCRAELERLVEERGLPGATLALVLPDGEEVAVAAGLADREDGTPMDPDQLMLGGSTGKTWVAALALLYVNEGKLSLDDPFVKFFERRFWLDHVPNARKFKVRHLLRHESGVPEHIYNTALWKRLNREPDKVFRPEDLIFYVFGQEPLFEPGEGWSYADTNYVLLGMILEELADADVFEQIRVRLMEPHGFERTLHAKSRTIPGLATGYTAPESAFGFPERVIDGEGRLVVNPQFEWCGGGLATTSRELARWARILFRGEAFEGDYLEAMLASVPARTGRGHEYGLGVQVVPTSHGKLHGHSGFFPGYLTGMGYLPDHELALAFQTNTDRIDLLGVPPFAVLERFAGIALEVLEPVEAGSEDGR